MANLDIRTALFEAKTKGVYQYKVAEALGVSEATLVRWLRKEMSEDRKKAILKAIDTAK